MPSTRQLLVWWEKSTKLFTIQRENGPRMLRASGHLTWLCVMAGDPEGSGRVVVLSELNLEGG